jgi:hypothetical protein
MFEINTDAGPEILTREDYCDWLTKPASHGGDLEVQILSQLLKVDIIVFSMRLVGAVQTLHGMAPHDIFRGRGSSAESTRATGSQPLPQLCIVRTGACQDGNGHFDAVLPIDGVLPCSRSAEEIRRCHPEIKEESNNRRQRWGGVRKGFVTRWNTHRSRA